MFRLKLPNLDHSAYTSKRAKEEYAKQLISISEKVFLAVLLPLFGFMLVPTNVNVGLLVFAVPVFICAGLRLRHIGLKVFDYIEANKNEVIDANQLKP